MDPIVMQVLLYLGILALPATAIVLYFRSRRPEKIMEENFKSPSDDVFVKRYEDADLSKFRGTFLLTSFIVVLSVLLVAFTVVPGGRDDVDDLAGTGDEDIEMIPPVTNTPPPKQPPPPPPPEIVVVEDSPEEEPPPEIFELDPELDVPPPPPPPPPKETTVKIWRFVEKEAAFPGGQEALDRFFNENLQYPEDAYMMELEGTVWAEFVVNENGKISDIKIIKNLKGGFDEEVKRCLKQMPAWNPGEQQGKPIKMYMQIPIEFKLR